MAVRTIAAVIGGAAWLAAQGREPPPQAPAAQAGIVGVWRNANGYARFNADGTGIVSGIPGRYTIEGNLLRMTGEDGTVALPFRLEGDTLTLTVNARPVVLQRIKEEAGPGHVRREMAGTWCVVPVSPARRRPQPPQRCLTFHADGTYEDTGETGEPTDAGTWTATATSLTLVSRTRGTRVHALGTIRNPQTNAPLLVIDGQALARHPAPGGRPATPKPR